MFALVLWEGANSVSVVPLECTKKGKGSATLAKWGNSWYKAAILNTSGKNIIYFI